MREKQIEEMANEINKMDEPNAHYYGRNLKMHEAFADCFTIARHLYNKGYRKQSETINEFADRLKERLHTVPTVYNSHFGRLIDSVIEEMKGGAE